MVSKSSEMLLLPGRGVSQLQGPRIVLPLNSAQGLTSYEGTKDCFQSGEENGKRFCQEVPRQTPGTQEATNGLKEHARSRFHSMLSPLGREQELAETLHSAF